jgi:hypothetical protein
MINEQQLLAIDRTKLRLARKIKRMIISYTRLYSDINGWKRFCIFKNGLGICPLKP